MPVDRVVHDSSRHTVGLVGVSSYQGWYHMLGRSNAQATPGYGTSVLSRFNSTLWTGGVSAATAYSWNGHTALMTRESGRVLSVVGFNPRHMMYAGAMALFTRQFACTGMWYDDNAMLDDPTAISHEIPVNLYEVDQLDTFLRSLVGRSDMGSMVPMTTPFEYTFKPGDMQGEGQMRSNCGHAAIKVLSHYLRTWGKDGEAGPLEDFLEREQNAGQGPMMRAIGRGFQN